MLLVGPEKLAERRLQLKQLILEYTRFWHQQLLNALPPESKDMVTKDQLWHRCFTKDNIPPITQSVLPIHPLAESKLQQLNQKIN